MLTTPAVVFVVLFAVGMLGAGGLDPEGSAKQFIGKTFSLLCVVTGVLLAGSLMIGLVFGVMSAWRKKADR